MRRRFLTSPKPALTLLYSLLLPAIATAAAEEDVYFSELPVVASVSRLPQPLADAPTSVTVIDRDVIKASGARDLSDVFRLIPGFQTYPHTTEAPRVSYHGLGDGDYASRVQVLVDGRSMFSPLFGSGVNWATLPVALEDIERIEVVRGTNAVSYGSTAYLGVINIITVDPSLVRGVSVSTNYGNQNVRDYTLRAGGKLGESGNVRLTYRSQNDDALTNRYDWVDSYRTELVDMRADLALSDRDSLQISAGQAEGGLQNGRLKMSTGQSDPLNPIRDLEQKHTYAQFLWRRVLSPTSDVQLRYAHIQDRSSDAFSVTLPAIPPAHLAARTAVVNSTGDEGTRDELELQHAFRWSSSTRVVWGAHWQHDTMRSDFALPGQGTVARDNGRVFGNTEWKPAAWFTGNLGLAVENDSMAGSHVAPRLSTNFHLDQQNTLRLGVSRAYLNGNTVDYRGDWWLVPQWVASWSPFIPGLTPEYGFRAARNLPAERLSTVEIGYLGDWRDWRSSLDVRVFDERIHNRHYKIDMGYTNPLVASSTIPIQNVEIYGVEYQFRWQPLEGTRLMLSQTFARIAADYLPSALALTDSSLGNASKRADIENFTEHSMPSRTTALLLMQKLPYGLEFSAASYWQEAMKWSTNTSVGKYQRLDARIGYPFRFGALGGELALTAQTLDGSHLEYKGDGNHNEGRLVERRQWVSLRLDY